MPEVHSTNIRSIDHYPNGNLRVQFHTGTCPARKWQPCRCDGGRVYNMQGVKAKLYQTFLSAPSKGKFFAKWIAPHKKGTEMKDGPGKSEA